MGLYKVKDILRLERIKRGWTQEDVAKKLNIARASYAKYETGDNLPTTENIVKLADLYNVPTDYLLCRTTDFKTVSKKSFNQGMQLGEDIADKLMQKKRIRKKKSE